MNSSDWTAIGTCVLAGIALFGGLVWIIKYVDNIIRLRVERYMMDTFVVMLQEYLQDIGRISRDTKLPYPIRRRLKVDVNS
jgi:hypothetical protein